MAPPRPLLVAAVLAGFLLVVPALAAAAASPVASAPALVPAPAVWTLGAALAGVLLARVTPPRESL